jgi:hypothetical protein
VEGNLKLHFLYFNISFTVVRDYIVFYSFMMRMVNENSDDAVFDSFPYKYIFFHMFVYKTHLDNLRNIRIIYCHNKFCYLSHLDIKMILKLNYTLVMTIFDRDNGS